MREQTGTSEYDLSASGEVKISPKLNLATALKQTGSRKDSHSTKARSQSVEKYVHTKHSITSSGGPEYPSWKIASPIKDQILEGPAIKANKFARVLPTGPNARVLMKVVIPEHAIRIQDSTGAFNHVNKQILGLRRIRKSLCDQAIMIQDLKVGKEVEQSE